jgi:4-amino-4-deoxy-L-arabinose transferase-like glycosyltransferase
MSAESIHTTPQPAIPDVPPTEPSPAVPPLPVRRVTRPWVPPPASPPAAVARPDRATALRRAWAARAVWMGLLALAVGAGGQILLFQEPLRGPGALLLAVALLLAGLAWSGIPDAPLLQSETAVRSRAIAWRLELALRLVGIAEAVGLLIAALVAYMAAPNEIFGLQGWLWVGSMLLLLASCARWYPSTSRETDLGPAWTRGEAAIFLGLIALSLVTHLAYLDAIPWRFHFDESYAFTEAMRYYNTPALSLFTTTWHETSLPSLWFAFAAGLMHFAGTGLGGVRFGVALIGACLVIPVYGLARLVWGRTAAVLAACGPAISAVAIHYSRVSINNITTAFFWTVCFYFLLRGLRSRRPGDFVWAGLAAGTSQYTYYGTRLLPVLLLVFVVYLLVFYRRALQERVGHFGLLALGFLAGFGPLLGYFLQHPTMWASRSLYFLDVPAEIPLTWDGWVRDWNILAPLAWLNFLGLSVVPGRDTVYYAPLLLAPEAVLLVLGLGVLGWRWRQPAAFLLLLAAFGVVMTGGLLLEADTIPNFAHWAPIFPVVYLALALPLALGLRALRRVDRRLWLAGGVLLVGGLAWDAGANIYSYLIDYPARVPPDHSLEAVQGRFLEQVGPHTAVYIFGPSWQPLYPEVAALMGPHTLAANLLDPPHQLPLVGDPTRDLAFLFYNDQWGHIDSMRQYYPGGRVEELHTPDGNHVASAYIVSATQAMRSYGVQLVLSDPAGRPLWQGQVPSIGALPAGITPAYPLTATWAGALNIGWTSQATFSIVGSAAQIVVQGQSVAAGQPVVVQPPWMPIQVQARLDGPAALHLLLKVGSSPPAEIDTAHLWPKVEQTQGFAPPAFAAWLAPSP